MNRHWRLTTNHSYMHMKRRLAYAPEYTGYIGATCYYGSWDVSLSLQQLAGLYTAPDGVYAADCHKENATLLNATVGWNAAPGVTLWGKGTNLLAQRYEYVSGYPMPKATFMAGVRVSF